MNTLAKLKISKIFKQTQALILHLDNYRKKQYSHSHAQRVCTSIRGTRYNLGKWTLHSITNTLYCDEASYNLPYRLYKLLTMLVVHPGEILSKDVLLASVWEGRVVSEDSLAVAVSQLRKILGDRASAPQYIKTISGVGYQLVCDCEVISH